MHEETSIRLAGLLNRYIDKEDKIAAFEEFILIMMAEPFFNKNNLSGICKKLDIVLEKEENKQQKKENPAPPTRHRIE